MASPGRVLEGSLQALDTLTPDSYAFAPVGPAPTKKDAMASKIEDRIRALLRLAKSNNVHEAANAANRAQLLMEKHRIEVTLEDGDGDEEYVYGEPLETASRPVMWKGHLLDPICDANGCRGLWILRGGKALLVAAGPPRDVASVRYLYRYLVRELDQLAKRLVPKNVQDRKLWIDSFRYGAITIITLRLRAATEQAWDEVQIENPAAVSVIEKRMAQCDRVREWVLRDTDVTDGEDFDGELDLEAFNQGMRTAGNITLKAKGGALPEGVE